MWYTDAIDNVTCRLTILAALLATFGPRASQAQGPREVSARGTAARLAFSLPAGATGAAGLGRIFDASVKRRILPAGSVVAAPRLSERSPAPPFPKADKRPSAARLHQELVVPVPKATPVYRRTFSILLSQPRKTDRWDELIVKYARKYRLDARFLKSIMAAESEFDPRAVSPAGARGLMQVMPVTAASVGVPSRKLNDPEYGIKAGAAYIQQLFKTAWRLFRLRGVRYTDVPHWVMQRVVAAYHAGPRFLTRNRWFASTRAYVRKVVLFYHSKVTDLRRPKSVSLEIPSFSETVAPSGILN